MYTLPTPTLSVRTRTQHTRGFTIVELLIVIIVIAILATITIVSYNGLQQRAYSTTLKADFSHITQKAELYRISSTNDSYPESLAEMTTAGFQFSKGSYNAALWCYDNATTTTKWAIVADSKDGKTYYYSNITNSFTQYTTNTVQGYSGGVTCPGINASLVGWTWILQTPTGAWGV